MLDEDRKLDGVRDEKDIWRGRGRDMPIHAITLIEVIRSYSRLFL